MKRARLNTPNEPPRTTAVGLAMVGLSDHVSQVASGVSRRQLHDRNSGHTSHPQSKRPHESFDRSGHGDSSGRS